MHRFLLTVAALYDRTTERPLSFQVITILLLQVVTELIDTTYVDLMLLLKISGRTI